MSKFKVGDIVSPNVKHPWEAEITSIGQGFCILKLVSSWQNYYKGFTWDYWGGVDKLNLVTKLTKQEKLIRKIQYLYKNSPSQFEKRWVKE